MLMLLPIVVALAANDPAPAASSAPRPTPLTEIGRVRAIPACVPIVAHANGAITQALDNDRTLAVMTTNMRNTDFDKLNFMQRKNAIEVLTKQAELMRIASSAGEAEVKKLREFAANSADSARKEELKTFADALGGALYRQKKAAVELQRDVAVLQGREDAAEARGLMRAANPVPPFAGAIVAANTPSILPGVPDSYNKQFKGMSDTLDDLTRGIRMDEGTAADHSIAATSGC